MFTIPMSTQPALDSVKPNPANGDDLGGSDLKLSNSNGQNSGEETLIPLVDKDEPLVTRKELWSYYLYYNGDCGMGPFFYTQILFQALATGAGYDPIAGPGSSCTAPNASGQCVLPWGSGSKPVTSIILVSSGISFAIMTAIFTTISSAGDYGTFGRWFLLLATIICWAAQYSCMALTSPSRWKFAMALYIISFVSYGATIVFYSAAFPRLARNTPYSRQLHERYERGEIPVEEYEREQSLEKNRISNISTVHSNIGYIATYALNLAILLPRATAKSPLAGNYILALDTTYWVVLGIWWFIFQLPRPGPALPKGEHFYTIGWKQIWVALKAYKHLPQTFIYLFAFFLLADALNTSLTLVSICQNAKFGFSFLTLTYLGLVQGVTCTIGTYGFWYIQRHWKISTKKMFAVTNVMTILIPLWGMVGIWTNKFGFHNAWEFWAYNVVSGLFQAPYFAYSQTMMAEVSPPGFDNMFFGLFGLSNRASSILGPNVIQAIIDKTGSNWQGFPFLFALSTLASLVIWFAVDVKKGRRDAVKWASSQRVSTM